MTSQTVNQIVPRSGGPALQLHACLCVGAVLIGVLDLGLRLLPGHSAAQPIEKIRLLESDQRAQAKAVTELLGHRRQQAARTTAGGLSYAPSAQGADEEQSGQADLGSLKERIDRLAYWINSSPRLQLAHSSDDKPTLADVLYSADFFRSVLRDADSTLEQRAISFASLARLPGCEAHFDDYMRRLWREDVFLAFDSPELGYLAEVYRWLEPGPEELSVYRHLLVNGSQNQARENAVEVLESALDSDPGLQDVFRWLADNDFSPGVRRRIHDAQRGLARRRSERER